MIETRLVLWKRLCLLLKFLNVNPHIQGKGNMGDFFDTIQDDLGEKFNIFGGDSVGHCEKKVYMNMCLNLNRNRVRAFEVTNSNTF